VQLAPVISITLCLLLGVLVAAHVSIYAFAPSDESPTDPCDAPRRRLPLRIVIAEVIASLWLAAAALWPRTFPVAPNGPAAITLLILSPPWLPARALGPMARRLARAGALVDVVRTPHQATPAALARLAARAERLGRRVGQTPALLFFDRAGRLSARLVEMLGTPAAASLLLGPVAVHDTHIPRHATIVRASDDAWASPLSTSVPRNTIVVEGLGHLSLAVAPHVADVVADALATT